MARPGFVLEVDERTPPLVVPNGLGYRLERFPLGTKVVYPAEGLAPVPDVSEAIDDALDHPLESEPLSARLRPGMRLRIAFDDISTPVPRMTMPDIRGRIIEAVLRRAAAAGVDDVALVSARGLHRKMTRAELEQLLGERVFRSFYADGRLRDHDAEDADQLSAPGAGDHLVSTAASEADLLVFVHIAGATGNGVVAMARGLGSTSTISRFAAQPDRQPDSDRSDRSVSDLPGGGLATEVERQLGASVPLFQIEAVLDNAPSGSPLQFLAKREWEWNVKDQAAWLAVRRGLALTSTKARRQLVNSVRAGYAPIQITAGAPAAVASASSAKMAAQQVVEVPGQADVAILGVPHATPYSVDSVTNPILAAWSALGAAFSAHTGRPVVRAGGALILYHPMTEDFSPLHHPSYVDFFAEVLTSTTEPAQVKEFELRFASDPWYAHLYRNSFAFHGVHPFHLWYAMGAARTHCRDIIWVGADRATVGRLGFRAASTLADALEIVSSTVGRTPSITYLHSAGHLVTDIR